ncbi:MAG: HEAT repeat domain-containing protein [Vicinamibacterales bacterium]
MKQLLIGMALAAIMAAPSAVRAGEPGDSQRLERAKDLIADEQWERAIEQLKAAAADPKERSKDEALFWLAHSQHQARDLAAALQTIAELERRHASSRWVKPANSLRVEIAQKLQRTDVLWMTAAPPAPPGPPSAMPPARAPQPAAPRSAPPVAVPAPGKPPLPPAKPAAGGLPAPPPRLSTLLIPEGWSPDTNLRIQALGSLIQTDATRVIPMLREIALESGNPREASRAVFVLAQSGNPEAHSTVVDVARRGAEVVRIAAVRELGRFGGPAVSDELVKLYGVSSERVKYQVVNALGDRAATSALLRIAQTESNRRLQERAIVRIGQAGGSEQLRRFYTKARPELKHPIINGLFNARAVEELIYIAGRERDARIRSEVLTRLRLLNTVKAREYLEKQSKK